MALKKVEAKGNAGVPACQHWKPTNPGDERSCLTCGADPDDREICSEGDKVKLVVCSLRSKPNAQQLEALKVTREIPRNKIKKIGHHVKKTDSQADLLDRDRLSKDALNKENLNLFS